MNVVRYEPWNLLNDFHREVDNYFKRASDNDDSANNWTPAVDIKEAENEYVLLADLPGVDPAAIELNVEDNILTLSGQRETNTESDVNKLKRTERQSGHFSRQFTLPDSVNTDNINATSHHGVLAVTIPKQEKTAPRKISVDVSA